MATLTPIDGDPFASQGAALTPIDGDPFAGQPQAAAPQPQTAAPSPPHGYWNGALQFANSALLGAGTKEMAAVQAIKEGFRKGQWWDPDTYDYALTHYNAARDAYQTENPKTAFAADVAGSVPPAMVLGGAIGPMAGEGIGGALLTNAGTGGAMGAASGAINTDGSPADRLKAALMQGGLGAGLGAAAVPVGAVAGKVAGATGQRLADALFTRMNGAGLTPDAADSLAKAFAMQGQAPSEALTAAQGLGPGATFADTGQATRDLTARLAAREPNAAPVISQNLTDRTAELAPRISQAVTAVAGPDFNAVDQLAALKAKTAANGAANYQPVMNSGATVDVQPVRDMIAQTRVDPVADGVREDPISQALARAQGLFVGRDPSAVSIRVVHNAQTAIGDQANAALRSGNLAQARALTNVRNGLLDQMPDEYNAARAQYASDKGIEDAFQEGRSVLASRTDGQVFDPDFLKSRLQGMSQPEQDAYRLGARKSLTDVMGQARNDPAGMASKLANENGYAADKLRNLFGAGPVNGLLDELDKQAQIRATNSLALGGSKTAMATAADNLIPTANMVGAMGHGGGGALSMLAGAELGSHLGRSLGQETAGAILGAGAGTLWNGVAAPAINAGRQASQDASRLALARALTERPSSALVDALSRRAATSGIGAGASGATSALARALMIANAPRLGQESQDALGR